VSAHLEFPRPVLYDSDYWLCRCEGFQVETPTGRLGVVTGVRFRSRHDRPDELVVQGGLLSSRHYLVQVSEVAEIVPREERISLRTSVG
jgi:hypothetical protein